MKTTSEVNLKYEDGFRYEDDLKYEENLKNDIPKKTFQSTKINAPKLYS